MTEHNRDPLTEFDRCPLETREGILLVRETEDFLRNESRPKPSAVRRFGSIVLHSLAQSPYMFFAGVPTYTAWRQRSE